MNNMKKPFFSVITVTYNAQDCIIQTLNSISEQDKELFELVIIDGSSTDSTLSLIQSHPISPSYLITEPDLGIYDAMNKGVSHANGEYIIFMNAGDYFYDKNTLTLVYSFLSNNPVDLYAGATLVKYSNGNEKIKNCYPIGNNCLFTPICHQSLYAKKTLLIQYPFNLEYKIAADFNFILDVIKNKGTSFIIEKPLSIISAGGISDIKRKTVWLEYENITNNQYGKSIVTWLFYRKKIFSELLKKQIKNILNFLYINKRF